MKKNNILFTIMSMIFVLTLMTISTKVKATDLSTPIYFGVQEFRSGTTPNNMAYGINDPYANGSTTASIVGTKIWQIVKYNTNVAGNYTTGNYYCVRAGVGFRNVNDIAAYNRSYDLKTEKNAILSSGNTVLQSIVNNGYFNNLLALTDLLYLKGVSTSAEKTALLNAANIYDEDYTVSLTDSDIEAVQQAAIWYFSNHDDVIFERVFNNYDEEYMSGGLPTKTSWLTYSTLEKSQSGNLNYTSLSDYNLKFSEKEFKSVMDYKDKNKQICYTII